MKQRILIVDDEPHLTGLLEYLLQDEGYLTAAAGSAELARLMVEKEVYDLILLDINLPGISGIEFCRNLRKQPACPPVIFLSCREDGEDVVCGLESGAEDYITKPFNHRELILRVEKVLRRSPASPHIISCGDLEIDLDGRQIRVAGEPVHLTATEFSLLSCLAAARGGIVSWQELIERVWNYHDWEGGNEIVKVTIGRIRKKIEENPGSPRYLHNEWGRGYRLQDLRQ